MKIIKIIYLVLLPALSFGQWEELYKFYVPEPNGNHELHFHIDVIHLEDSTFAFRRTTGVGTPNNPALSKFISTRDNWTTFDSTQFSGYYTSGGFQKSGTNVYYPAKTYPDHQLGENYHGVFYSPNNGLDWEFRLIDSVGYGFNPRNLAVIHDSVLLYNMPEHQFLSLDYGQTWEELPYYNASSFLAAEDHFVYAWRYNFIQLDPYTRLFDTVPTIFVGDCFRDYTTIHNNVMYTSLHCQDGPEQGYSSNNYSGLIIDTLPIGGNISTVHFPDKAGISHLQGFQDYLYFRMGTTICRHKFGTNTYEGYQHPDVTDEDSITGAFHLMQNFWVVNEDTIYGHSYRPFSNEYKMWQTTTGLESPITVNPWVDVTDKLNLEEQELPEISLYPNPGRENVHVRCRYGDIDHVEVRDIRGRQILKQNVEQQEIELNTRQWNSGVYLISVTSGTYRQTLRWVKK